MDFSICLSSGTSNHYFIFTFFLLRFRSELHFEMHYVFSVFFTVCEGVVWQLEIGNANIWLFFFFAFRKDACLLEWQTPFLNIIMIKIEMKSPHFKPIDYYLSLWLWILRPTFGFIYVLLHITINTLYNMPIRALYDLQKCRMHSIHANYRLLKIDSKRYRNTQN